jgi:hypothetical protein
MRCSIRSRRTERPIKGRAILHNLYNFSVKPVKNLTELRVLTQFPIGLRTRNVKY